MFIGDIVFQKLKESRKYKYLCDDTLRRISRWAVERYDGRQAVKAAKNKLHQVYGAYFEKVDMKRIRMLVEGGGSGPHFSLAVAPKTIPSFPGLGLAHYLN